MTEAMMSALETLTDEILGQVILSGDDEYDRARALFNGAHDRSPHAIVRPLGAVDVVAAIRYAREHDTPIAVRGGGHHAAGYAGVDEGIVIDLSLMRAVWVDRDSGTARVQGGALWADVDRATQQHGLAVTGGTISHVGVAGFTLGGGIGHLTRAHGLAADNLVSVELVTADGRLVNASADEHPSLFWAVRGGGGNFGVVTSLEFRLHEIGTEVWGGPITYAIEDAPKVLRVLRDLMTWAPGELNASAMLVRVPPLPQFPAALHGKPVLVVVPFWTSDPAAAGSAVRPLREAARPLADLYGPVPYLALQSANDAAAQPGRRGFETSDFLAQLSDETIDRLVRHVVESPVAPRVALQPLGGAAGGVPANGSAFGGRSAAWLVAAGTTWEDPAGDDDARAWVGALHQVAEADTLGFGYVNMIADGYAAYPSWTRARLRAIKGTWDPANVFRGNYNIEPLE